MRCRGCGEERKLIKAHIIPRAFYLDLRRTEKFLYVIPPKSVRGPLISHAGDYDSSILCQNCDQYLARFDEYGKQVLIDSVHPFTEISRAGVVIGWTIEECDAIRLEKFILAVLWRASISTRPFFYGVKLGPYEQILRNHLWSDVAHHEAFGCALARFAESSKASGAEKSILNPHPFRFEGKKHYRLYLGGYVVWVRVDRRKSASSIGVCELSTGQETVVVKRSFDDSDEFGVMRRGVNLRS